MITKPSLDPRLRLRTKILLTIALAVLVWSLFGCRNPEGPGGSEVSAPRTIVFTKTVVTAAYLKDLYRINNETFFQNKLPKDSEINLSEETDMASTMCQDDGTECVVKFNLKYVLAKRVADFTMLHEQCHIKIWNKELDSFGQQVEHGKVWRTCMLQLDAAGAFREIIIDGYSEGM